MLPLLLTLASPPRPFPAGRTAPAESRIRIVPQYSAGFVQDIEESRDGTRLLTHDKGYAPRLWDAKRQVLLRVLDGHPDSVDLVNFSLDGSRVLTRSHRLVRVWDSARAKVIVSYPMPEGQNATAAVMSPDGKMVAIGTDKGAVALYTGAAPKPLGTHAKAVRSLAFSPDGARLVSGSDDGTGRFWDLKTGKPLTAITGHKGPIRWFDFSPRGEVLATSLDDTASLWDASGKHMATYPQVIGSRSVENVGMAAVFVGKGLTEVAACDAKGTIQLFKPGATKPSRALVGHRATIRELRKSQDGRFVSTYGDDETLRMWDVVAGKEMPFDALDDTPTAGEFSPNRDVFWLGYLRGEVRQFDIKANKAVKETFGSVSPIAEASLNGDASTVFWRVDPTGSAYGGGNGQLAFLDPTGGFAPLSLELMVDRSAFSPNGRYYAYSSQYAKRNFMVVDLATQTAPFSLEEERAFNFSPDSTRIAVIDGDKGEVDILNMKTGKPEHSWEWEVDKQLGGIAFAGWHPNGDWVLTSNHPEHGLILWDADSGKEVKNLGKYDDVTTGAVFDPAGKWVVTKGYSGLVRYDLETGKPVWTMKAPIANATMPASADGKRIPMIVSGDQMSISVVVDADTGKELLRVPMGDELAVSPDGKRAITAQEKIATVWDLDTGKPLYRLPHANIVDSVGFGPKGNRPVTGDRLEGMHVWSAKGARLAHVVVMNDGEWLVYDDQGRYDASDPSTVDGAKFVLEWEEGLEPIDMPQLKGQFYEPKLLAKALGLDDEPLRDVPNLESLRLFPELTVKQEDAMTYTVSAKARDEGGIGTIRVAVNGKEVLKKKGAGYFKLDLKPYEGFLLPESRLGEGGKNLLSVTVSNESGELVSPAEVLDIGVPADLKAPDVKLYALCVGIGDYAGKTGDLQAPPSDAAAIGQALKEVSDRLLPGKTEVTVMTTAGDAARPTRDGILGWLKSTAAKATSSDIVFVFVAGHGTNKIGDASGYFMLTPEADPGEITPATAKTGAISGEELRQALAAIPAGKQVVVLDTCHSGAASSALIAEDRSVSGEYQRAWEAIKDTTGTWLLAGAAADQKSYESPNVDHGMLTYALLEAVDKASADGLRKTPSGEMFVDVERWLNYAANRVESLKAEVGIKGVQRPEFKRATRGETFDIGVMDEKRKGFLGLKAPLPIVIVGDFEQDQEDPLNLEEAVAGAMRDAKAVKPWFEVAKHPGVYRMTGEYTITGDEVKVRLILQAFDERQQRKNLETVEITGTKDKLPDLAAKIRSEIEARIKAREKAKE